MAQHVIHQSSIDSLARSESTLSLQSDTTFDSRRSSYSTLYRSDRRKYGFFNKVGNSLNTFYRRFTRKYKSLSALEIQILSTITQFNREEILQW